MRMRRIIKNSREMGGHSKTHQRELLLDIIRQTDGHLDARELFRRAAEKNDSISPATVYRSLNLFQELGLVEKKQLGKAQCFYELKRPVEHQHLVCSRCGKVIDFACPLKDMIGKVRQEQGFTVTRAEVYFEGFCSDCNEKEKTKRGEA